MPLLDKLREQYGVGPLCSELHIAPSTYYHCQQQRHHPDKRSARAQRDDWLKKEGRHAGSGGTPLRQRSSVVSSGVADG
ncbi:hypothetical protein ABL386_004923, partial [Escherichia coli]|nr:hypothetical protein RG72_24255 [Escherichia coli]EFK2973080.1 hypothetical protein [Escherichia coli]EHY5564732.1 hypothetical protein [Escherichia coli]HAH3188215.1 hypothetical protein [Escherichia coli]HAM8769970.1 hypothetical protein [Escherichia coli]